MSLTMWQFISQGGTVRTNDDHTVNTIVLTANTDPYPISGYVVWTENHSTKLYWDVNGVAANTNNNIGLNLAPVSLYVRYLVSPNTTLESANSYSDWLTKNNVITN